MSTRQNPDDLSNDAEFLRQRLLHRARTLLFTNPRMAEECREKARMLLRQQGGNALRRRA